LTAALAAGGIALSPRVAHAEPPDGLLVRPQGFLPPYGPERILLPLTQIKKPIYDEPDPVPGEGTRLPPPGERQPSAGSPASPGDAAKARGPTPTDRLAAEIRRVRLFLYRRACAAEDAVNAGMDRVFDLEQSFTSTIESLAPPRESGERLMPGLIYVLVAAMAGSIVTRNRNLVLRAATPLAFGVSAAWVVIPITMGNVSQLIWKYEQRFPALANAHAQTRESIRRGWSFAQVHAEVGVRKLDEKVGEARTAVERWVSKGK
jgi:organizing structure protein 2